MDLSVSDIQEQLTRGKAEYNARLGELRTQRATEENAGRATADLAKQIQNLGTVYHQSVVWLSEALLEAKYRERNESPETAKARQDAEEFARNAAMASYTKAGGVPDQFDILWSFHGYLYSFILS